MKRCALVAVCAVALALSRPAGAAGGGGGLAFRDADLPAGTVARLPDDGTTVSAQEVAREVRASVSPSHGGEADPAAVREDALVNLVDRILLLRQPARARDPRLERLRRIWGLLHLGLEYEREVVAPSVKVSEAELAAYLPASRDEIKGVILPFRAEDEAAVLKELGSGRAFAEVAKRYSLAREGIGDEGRLGWLDRGKTTFDPEVEEHLWGLEKGRVSRALDTPLGRAVVLVEDRRRIDDRRWRQLEEQGRATIRGRRLATYLAGARKRHETTVDEVAFTRVARAMHGEDRWTDARVGSVGPVEIYFHDLDRILKASYQDVVRKATWEMVRDFYRGYFDQVAARVALGLAAEAEGRTLSAGRAATLRQDVMEGAIRIAVQDAIREVRVTDRDVARRLERDKDRLAGAEAARLRVLVTQSLGDAEAAARLHREGVPFVELVRQYSVDPATKGRDGDMGMVRFDRLPPEIRDEIPEAKPGDLLPVFVTGVFYNLALLEEKGRSVPVPRDVAERLARRRLLAEGREAAVSAFKERLRKGVAVEVDRAELGAVPVPKPKKAAVPHQFKH